jgi:ribose-phosphate pyrophosphokinase
MPILVNNQPIESFTFAGGECHVAVSREQIKDQTTITALLENSDDIMKLLLTIDAVRRIRNTAIDLRIPYVPYARQDRVCNPGEALSIRVMADIINGMGCRRVTIVDPHSDVTSALINNCHVITQAEVIKNSPLAEEILLDNWALVSPDAGAAKKIQTVAKAIAKNGAFPDVFCASKVRDTRTGAITSTAFHDDVKGRTVLIVDDICDGGRTFIELATLLNQMGTAKTMLYVTHGIFSKGLDLLRESIAHVYCHHTMLPKDQLDPLFLTVFEQHNN